MSTILIADDEARIRRLVSDFLKRDGHTILEAAMPCRTLHPA